MTRIKKDKLKKIFLENDIQITVNVDGLKKILIGFLMFQEEMATIKCRFNSSDQMLDMFLQDLLNRHMNIEKVEL